MIDYTKEAQTWTSANGVGDANARRHQAENKQRKLHEQQQDGGLGVVGAGGEERGRGACIAAAMRRDFPQRGSKIQSWSPERLAGALFLLSVHQRVPPSTLSSRPR